MCHLVVGPELRELAKWMREVGATRACLPDGTQLELGPSTVPLGEPLKHPSPKTNELAERQRKLDVLFAASSTRPKLVAT